MLKNIFFLLTAFLMISDKNGNQLYIEFPTAYWVRREFDSQGNKMYYENSDGDVEDNRPKPCEGKVVEIDGVKYKLVKV